MPSVDDATSSSSSSSCAVLSVLWCWQVAADEPVRSIASRRVLFAETGAQRAARPRVVLWLRWFCSTLCCADARALVLVLVSRGCALLLARVVCYMRAMSCMSTRAWRWQKCFELAYFQVAPPTGSIRSTVGGCCA
jgi:hypothetical protein